MLILEWVGDLTVTTEQVAHGLNSTGVPLNIKEVNERDATYSKVLIDSVYPIIGL